MKIICKLTFSNQHLPHSAISDKSFIFTVFIVSLICITCFYNSLLILVTSLFYKPTFPFSKHIDTIHSYFCDVWNWNRKKEKTAFFFYKVFSCQWQVTERVRISYSNDTNYACSLWKGRPLSVLGFPARASSSCALELPLKGSLSGLSF